jgi:membrane protease subunit HflK
MSDEHDHHHDHDHSHDHGHEHAHGDIVLKRAPAPTPEPEPPVQEDAGSQALAEALRSSFGIVKVLMIVLVLVFFGSGFFKVEQNQKAVILRFGKPSGQGTEALLGAGLHWSLPYPIDEVVKIPYSQLMTVRSTVGWFRITPEDEALGRDPYGTGSLNPAQDGYAVAGDGFIIHTRATLIYRIDDPIAYEFDFVNASNAVRNDLDNALLYAAARFKVDDILTHDIERFKEVVTTRVTDLVQQQKLGVVIENCQVESRPPIYLKGAFDSVLTATLTRDKVRSDALSYQNQVLSKAAADAASRTNSAQAQRVLLVGSVKAEAQRFNDLLPRYEANPAVFENILLAQELGRVLTNVQDKIYMPERADGKTRELRLQLSREPLAPKGAGQ